MMHTLDPKALERSLRIQGRRPIVCGSPGRTQCKPPSSPFSLTQICWPISGRISSLLWSNSVHIQSSFLQPTCRLTLALVKWLLPLNMV